MSDHTKGPLFVTIDERFAIVTKDTSGTEVFRREFPCASSKDKTALERIQCINFYSISDRRCKSEDFSREKCSQINRTALADEILRAAAPELLDLCERAILALSDIDQYVELRRALSAAITKAKGGLQ